MSLFRFSTGENRLLNVTLDDVGGVKYNRRNAEINAANQQAQRQAQVKANQALPRESYIDPKTGLDTRAPVKAADTQIQYYDIDPNTGKQRPTFLVQSTGETSFTQPGTLSSGSTKTLADPVTGVPKQQLNQPGYQVMNQTIEDGKLVQKTTRPSGAMGQTGALGYNPSGTLGSTLRDDIAKSDAAIDAIYNRRRNEGGIVDQAGVEEEKRRARETITNQAKIAQADKQMQKDKEASTAGTGAPTPNPEVQGLQAAMASLSPEEQNILTPLIENLQTQAAQGLTDNAARTKAMLEGGTIDGVQVQGINSTFKTLQDQIDGMKEDRKTMKDAVAEILKDSKEDNEALINEQERAAQERLTWNQHQQEVDLARQKTKTHESLIAQYALGGGFGQDAALTQVRESDASFDSALRDVQSEFGVQRTELSAKFTGLYVQNNNEYRNASLKNAEDYLAGMERLNAQGGQNTVAFLNSQTSLLEKSQAEQTRLTENLAKNNMDIGKTMLGMINQKRDDDRAQEQLGLNMLDKMIDNYGSNIPVSLLETVKKYLPNVDVADVARQRTLAQMKKGAGGGGGSVGSGVPSPTDATIAALYSDVTPQQLSEAVKRVFAPANYGGTASERVKRENEYLSRISKGESPASIVQSLQNDYWASQKGAPRTAHDERTTAQGSSEALQSYVDSYGITAEDDGVLGAFDGRWRKMTAWTGQNSQEYYDLANYVGNIRARIVKENYGAAVTPQELELAKSYIPDMNQPGVQFIKNLHNLKNYQAYLDAKVTAVNLGLPTPKPPTPVQMSGDKITGASKYSIDDINSTLSE